MANPAWPASLPQDVRIPGFSENPGQATLRTTMDAGPAKVRRRFTSAVRPLQFTLHCTRAQIATLDDFYVNDLRHGSLRFDMTHPRTLVTTAFRFIKPPEWNPLRGDQWIASLSVEELP